MSKKKQTDLSEVLFTTRNLVGRFDREAEPSAKAKAAREALDKAIAELVEKRDALLSQIK